MALADSEVDVRELEPEDISLAVVIMRAVEFDEAAPVAVVDSEADATDPLGTT